MYLRYQDLGGEARSEVANAYAKRLYIVLLAFARNNDEKNYRALEEKLRPKAARLVREPGLAKKENMILRLYAANPNLCWLSLRGIAHTTK